MTAPVITVHPRLRIYATEALRFVLTLRRS